MSSESMEEPAPAPAPETAKPATRRWGGSVRLGIALDASNAEWTALSTRSGAMEVVGEGRESAPPAEGSTPAWKSARAADISLVLPATSALLRVARLPSTDPAELQGMAELQVDQFSPFPAEQLAISCEALGVHEGQTQLLIAAHRRDGILQSADQWLGPQARPRRVDLDILVWWRYASTLPLPTGNDRTLHIRWIAGTLWMIGTQDGHPILFRAMSLPGEESAALEDLIAEAELALTALEQEWGSRPCDLVIWDAASESLAARLAEALSVNVQSTRTPDDFRISRTAAEAEHPSSKLAAINLALPEWEVARSQKMRLHKIFYMTAAVLLIWVLAMGGLFGFVRIRSASLDRLKAALAKAQVPAAEVESMDARLAVLNGHLDQRHTALEILREATLALPVDGRMTSFSYRKGKSLDMRMEFPAQYSPEDYVKALRDSGLFDQIRPGRISEKSGPAGSISEFPVNGRWGEEEKP